MSRIAAAIAVLAPALPPVVAAEAPSQQAAAPEQPAQPVQRIVVTGSNIKRIDVETSDPVVILRRPEIERTGASTLLEFLQSLPWTTGSLTDLGGADAFASGASSTALRHLDKQSTLVLVNGRRVAPFALADFNEYFTNIDALPLEAIDRIEILKNGASAIYGSDAVAGVVNVITRQDYQGFSAGGDMQMSLNSHSFGENGLHAVAGFGDLKKDRFNVTASVQHFRRDPVIWRDVFDHAGEPSRALLPQGQDQLSYYSSPGNIGTDSVPLHAMAGCDASHVRNGVCWYDRYQRFEAVPGAARTHLLVSAKAEITPQVEAFAEFLWAYTRTTYQYTQTTYGSKDPATTWGDARTGENKSFYSYWLPPTHPLNDIGENAILSYRFTDTDPRQVATGHNTRLVTGVRGSVEGYDWETALSVLDSTASALTTDSLYSQSGFSRVIGGSTDTSNPDALVDPNFFNIPGGYRMGQQNSRAVLDVLFPQSGMQGRMKQTALDGKISGEVMDLPAGPMSFAAGYDLRHEQSVITPTDNVLQGDIVGLGALQTNAARTFGAVYGELDIPVVKPLDLQLAARADKFPGFGTHLSPKVGVRFQPTKDLLLRATAEGGFRAPNLSEAAPSKKVAFESVADPQRCDGAQRYASDLRAQAAGLPDTDPRKVALQVQAEQVANNECAAGVASVVNDNPALKPEVSHGYSLGLLFEPLPDTSFSLDYWAMDRKDEIGVKSTADVLAQEGALPFGVAVYRAPLTADRSFPTPELQQRYGITAGPITGVLNRFENISRTRTSGIDFAAKGRVGTRAGMLDLGLMGTHLNRFLSYSPVLGGYGDNLAGRYGFPRWSATASAALTSGAFLNGLQLTYSSGMSLQGDYYDTQWNPQGCAANLNLSPDQCRVAAYVRTDYFFSYTGFRNLTLSAHVSNLFNRLPPLDRRALDAGGYKTPQLEEAQRRTLQISLDYRFR